MGIRSWLRGRLDRFVAVEVQRLFEDSAEVKSLKEEVARLQEELRNSEEQLSAIEDRQEALGLVGFLYDDIEEQSVQQIDIDHQTCNVTGCNREHHRDGLCQEHYFERSKQGNY